MYGVKVALAQALLEEFIMELKDKNSFSRPFHETEIQAIEFLESTRRIDTQLVKNKTGRYSTITIYAVTEYGDALIENTLESRD